MRRVKFFLLVAAGIILSWTLFLPVAFSTTPVTLMSIPTSSGVFPYVVSIARVLSTYCPDFSVIVSESGGNMDNTHQIRSGQARLAHSVAFTDYASYLGMGPFKGKPFHDFRILWYYQKSLVQIAVAQDSGIETLRDLNGRTFSAGGTGTAAASLVRGMFDILDIQPKYFESDQVEAADAYASGEIDGVVKVGPAPDSFFTNLNAARPVRFLSLSLEDMARVLKAIPGARITFLPTNAYESVDYEVRCLATYNGIQADMSFSQEEGYHIFKAMWEDGKEIWQHAYPVGKDNDIPRITLEAALTPLHAGTVQYLEEHGFYVPEELIPEEYVPVR